MTRAWPLLLLFAACSPLTYYEDGKVDFAKYRSVRVDVIAPAYGADANGYFAQELRSVSGFAEVSTDPAVVPDVVLEVVVSATETTEPGEGNSQYEATANYALETSSGEKVDSGSATESSSLDDEAIEDTLDQVAAHYIAPYRY